MKKLILVFALIMTALLVGCAGKSNPGKTDEKNETLEKELQSCHWIMENPDQCVGLYSYTVLSFLPGEKVVLNTRNDGYPQFYSDQSIGDYKITGKLLEFNAGINIAREVIITNNKDGSKTLELWNSKNELVFQSLKDEETKGFDPFKGFSTMPSSSNNQGAAPLPVKF